MLVGDDAVEDAAKPERLEEGFDDLRGDDGEPDAVDAVRRGEGGRHGKASEVEHEGYDDDGVGDPGAVEGALDGALERHEGDDGEVPVHVRRRARGDDGVRGE